MKKCILFGVAAAAISMFSGQAEAQSLIATDFVSTGSRQNVNGTSLGMTTNTPGSTWIWGAGWDYAQPQITASWDPPGLPANSVALGEEDTALGVSLASNGGYTKPASFTLSSDLMFTTNLNNRMALGFWSVMPPRTNGAVTSFDNFTGLVLNEVAGTLQVYSGGSLSGSAVSVGALVESVFYNLSYTVDTGTGAISNVTFAGNGYSLTSSAFTDSATSFAGVLTASASRGSLDNFAVVAAVPEPSTWALMLGGLALLIWVRRAQKAKV